MAKVLDDVRSKDTIFPSVSSNPYVTVTFSLFMYLVLYISMGTEMRSGPDPFTTFVLGYLVLMGIAVNETRKNEDFSTLTNVLGFNTPLAGYNIMLGVMGVGIGIMAFQIANIGMSIFAGNTAATAAFYPFYNPYTAFPTQFSVTGGWTGILSVALYQFAVVALFEEIFKIIMAKNLSNWLHDSFGIKPAPAVATGILASFGIWTTWHWLSWAGLTLISIVTGVFYGIIFYTPWTIADLIGALSPDKPVTVTAIFVMPAITAHGTWNTLITVQGLGIGFASTMLLGGSLVLASLSGMLVIRWFFSA